MQERRVRVSERVPRDPWVLDPIARGSELPVVQVFIVERSPLDRPKNDVVRSLRRHARMLGFQHATKRRADGNYSPAAFRLGRSEFALRVRLRYFEGAAEQID